MSSHTIQNKHRIRNSTIIRIMLWRKAAFLQRKRNQTPVSSDVDVDPPAAELPLKCDQCEYVAASEKGLRQHIRMKHKASQPEKIEGSVLQTPEKERAPHQVADLQLTPVHQQRDEEDEMPSSLQSPPSTLPLVCDLPHSYSDRPCGQTFSSEDGLRVHADRWPLDLHS